MTSILFNVLHQLQNSRRQTERFGETSVQQVYAQCFIEYEGNMWKTTPNIIINNISLECMMCY